MTSGSSSKSVIRPPGSGSLPPAAELQRRWKLGQEPSIEEFLAEWPEISPRDLAAVLRVDLRQRWRQGEQLGSEEFLRRFPQLASEAELVVDLIYTEFLIREELYHRPALAEFEGRFPEHAQELKEQIELHAALGEFEGLPSPACETYQPAAATEQTIRKYGRHT